MHSPGDGSINCVHLAISNANTKSLLFKRFKEFSNCQKKIFEVSSRREKKSNFVS